MSPRRDLPDDRRRRDRYALLFGVQQVNVEVGPYIMPPYAWNETVIKDILGSEIRGISDMIVINPVSVWSSPGSVRRVMGLPRRKW